MKTTKLFAILLVAVLISAGGGYVLGKSRAAPGTTPSQQQTGAAKPDSQENNPYDGSNLSLMQMYDNLQSTSGDEFDRRLMAYLLAMNLNQTGMLRLADAKSEKSEFKEFARVQMKQNDKITELLYRWQKDWGYTDH